MDTPNIYVLSGKGGYLLETPQGAAWEPDIMRATAFRDLSAAKLHQERALRFEGIALDILEFLPQ